MKKGTTIKINGNIGAGQLSADEVKKRLSAAIKAANPRLKMWPAKTDVTVDAAGNLSGRAYITGNEAAPVDFKALAQDALASAVNSLRSAQGLAPAAVAAAPLMATTAGAIVELEESVNEDEDKGLIKPPPQPGAPTIAARTLEEAPRPKVKRLFAAGEVKPIPAAALAATAAKPHVLDECPLGGDGGDHQLNELKNRTKSATWKTVKVQQLLDLAWPAGIERVRRANWPSAAMLEVRANEQQGAMKITGWLASAKKEEEESCNCHSQTEVDYHLWLVDAKEKANVEDRFRSVVCEVTPRIRALHTGWGIERIRKIVHDRIKVRLSGWLLLDQEHPEQLPRPQNAHITRGTLWEMHPIIKFEVQIDGLWKALDNANL